MAKQYIGLGAGHTVSADSTTIDVMVAARDAVYKEIRERQNAMYGIDSQIKGHLISNHMIEHLSINWTSLRRSM